MTESDANYNVFRGAVITGNQGSTTNCNRLRVYKDMIVPELLSPQTLVVSSDKTISPSMILDLNTDPNTGDMFAGIPTLIKWNAGNLKLDKRFIALLPSTIQIMRV